MFREFTSSTHLKTEFHTLILGKDNKIALRDPYYTIEHLGHIFDIKSAVPQSKYVQISGTPVLGIYSRIKLISFIVSFSFYFFSKQASEYGYP